MARTDTFPLVDRLVPGGLGPWLTAAREAGDSYETIAFRLRTEHDVQASAETARKWCRRVAAGSPATEKVS